MALKNMKFCWKMCVGVVENHKFTERQPAQRHISGISIKISASASNNNPIISHHHHPYEPPTLPPPPPHPLIVY